MTSSWAALCWLLGLQVLVAALLLLATVPPLPPPPTAPTPAPIYFVPGTSPSITLKGHHAMMPGILVSLGEPLGSHFMHQNGSFCFTDGMEKKIFTDTGCICDKGWHGPDCGQPEVVWRALVRRRPPLPLPSRRLHPRRLIYVIDAGPSEELIRMAVMEASAVAELIIVLGGPTLQHHWCEKWCSRVLQLPPDTDWSRLVSDLRPDDLVSHWLGPGSFVPNSKALLFLKLYNGWPRPVIFRARWTVYGFYWLHPQRTISAPGAWLISDGTSKFFSKGESSLELGDLNHYGGWACVSCGTPQEVVASLPELDHHKDKLDLRLPPHVDVHAVEEAIGAGVWLDGKTVLIKARDSDHEFAPSMAQSDDLLLRNFYDHNTLDY